MKDRNQIFAALAWMQLVVSLILAVSTVTTYFAYRADLTEFVQSIASTVSSVSKIVGQSAATVATQQELLAQAGQMMLVTRKSVDELRAAVNIQAQVAPTYADALQSASEVVNSAGNTFRGIATAMNFQVPVGINFVGIKPNVVLGTPLAKQAQELQLQAQNMNTVSTGLSTAATTLSQSGKKLATGISDTTEQALKVITEVESTLARLKSTDLPAALAELKGTSENLQKVLGYPRTREDFPAQDS